MRPTSKVETLIDRVSKMLDEKQSTLSDDSPDWVRHVTLDITYEKNSSSDVRRYHDEATAFRDSKPEEERESVVVSDVFNQERLREMFCTPGTDALEHELQANGYKTELRPYSCAYGLIGCDLRITWE